MPSDGLIMQQNIRACAVVTRNRVNYQSPLFRFKSIDWKYKMLDGLFISE